MGIRNLFSLSFAKRCLTSIILIFVLIACIKYMDTLFPPLLVIVSVACFYEWIKMTNSKTIQNISLGTVVCLAPTIPMYIIYSTMPNGPSVVIWHIINISLLDTAAYLAGNIIGGPKILPKISPKKTWSGLIGAIIVSCAINTKFHEIISSLDVEESLIWGVVVVVVAQSGDFFESHIKRKYGVKDSGQILPGHGGVLDRVDGYIFSSIALLILCMIKS